MTITMYKVRKCFRKLCAGFCSRGTAEDITEFRRDFVDAKNVILFRLNFRDGLVIRYLVATQENTNLCTKLHKNGASESWK